MTEQITLYGHWAIAIFTITISSLFVLKFIPLKKKNWQALGITEAFIVALYTEMYGFPLTIYFLISVLGIETPLIHTKGHLWSTLLGLGEAGAMIEMFVGGLVTFLGLSLVIAGWKRIYQAKQAKNQQLVADGIYAHIRHPQYTGIIIMAFGSLIHWPTLPTLLMLPILITIYYKLAKKEEKEMKRKFGEIYQKYKKQVPMFVPLLLKNKKASTPVQ